MNTMVQDTPHVGVHVEFYIEPVPDVAASRDAGREIFKDEERIIIRFPGDMKREHVAPAHSITGADPVTGRQITYAEKYPLHYRAFKEQNEELVSGTPLSEVPWLTRSKVMELKALSIHNVETLADLDERTFQRLGMGARELRDKAKAWIMSASGSAEMTSLAAENADLKDRLDRLEKMISGGYVQKPEAAPAPVVADDEDLGPGADFENWPAEDIKAFLKDVTGKKPGGTPKHETLVTMARDAFKAERAKREAVAA